MRATRPATASSYDRVAARYAEELAGELAGKPLDRALLRTVVELAGGGPIVDVGCGPGHVSAHLSAAGGAVGGVDLSRGMCAVAAQRTGLPYATADMVALPLRAGGVAAIVCLYAVIHLDRAGRAATYAELARVLRPGGHALISFHTGDASTAAGGAVSMTEWWGERVDLTFRYLDPPVELAALAAAGLHPVARVDREPSPDVEHPSRRTYLLVRRGAPT